MFSRNTFPNFNVPPPELTKNHVIQEDVDQKISLFLKNHCLEPENPVIQQLKLRLSDINHKMNQVTQLKCDLERLYDDLKSNVNQLSEEEWHKKIFETEELQQKIDLDTQFLNENRHKIQRLIRKRQNKRKSRKNRKILHREHQKREIIQRQTKHHEINKSLKQIQDKMNAEKQAAVEKEETQSTLASVTKRIRETEEKLELFDSLIKLRQIKKQQSQRPERDTNEESFVEEISRMRTLWTLALEQYLEEEQKLQQYLDNKFKPQQTIEQQWNEVLFGPPISKKIDHPLLRAENNLNAFLTIRREWDACIVPPSDPAGSTIPLFWVLPNKNIADCQWQLK